MNLGTRTGNKECPVCRLPITQDPYHEGLRKCGKCPTVYHSPCASILACEGCGRSPLTTVPVDNAGRVKRPTVRTMEDVLAVLEEEGSNPKSKIRTKFYAGEPIPLDADVRGLPHDVLRVICEYSMRRLEEEVTQVRADRHDLVNQRERLERSISDNDEGSKRAFAGAIGGFALALALGFAIAPPLAAIGAWVECQQIIKSVKLGKQVKEKSKSLDSINQRITSLDSKISKIEERLNPYRWLLC